MRIVEAVKLKSFSKQSRSSYIGDNLSSLSEIFKEKIILKGGPDGLYS